MAEKWCKKITRKKINDKKMKKEKQTKIADVNVLFLILKNEKNNAALKNFWKKKCGFN